MNRLYINLSLISAIFLILGCAKTYKPIPKTDVFNRQSFSDERLFVSYGTQKTWDKSFLQKRLKRKNQVLQSFTFKNSSDDTIHISSIHFQIATHTIRPKSLPEALAELKAAHKTVHDDYTFSVPILSHSENPKKELAEDFNSLYMDGTISIPPTSHISGIQMFRDRLSKNKQLVLQYTHKGVSYKMVQPFTPKKPATPIYLLLPPANRFKVGLREKKMAGIFNSHSFIEVKKQIRDTLHAEFANHMTLSRYPDFAYPADTLFESIVTGAKAHTKRKVKLNPVKKTVFEVPDQTALQNLNPKPGFLLILNSLEFKRETRTSPAKSYPEGQYLSCLFNHALIDMTSGNILSSGTNNVSITYKGSLKQENWMQLIRAISNKLVSELG